MQNVTKLIPSRIYTCDFELFGKLHNAYIGRNTLEGARVLGITGWCESTKRGTFRGQLQGPPHKIMVMRNWLKDVPATRARIDFVKYSELKLEKAPTFEDFRLLPEKVIREKFVKDDDNPIKDNNNLL